METSHHLLAGMAEVGVTELWQALCGLFHHEARIVAQQKLRRPHIYRLRIEESGAVRSVVVKRLSREIAQRNEYVVNRWFPAAGLTQAGPPLLAVAAEGSGHCVWHVYNDLGDCSLAGPDPADGETELDVGLLSESTLRPDPDLIRSAFEMIAQVHARFREQPVLAECRLFGRDLGGYFYVSSVHDALRCLLALETSGLEISHERRLLLDRLRNRIEALRDEQPGRIQNLAEFGGPETLLHGDLSPKNSMVSRQPFGLNTRFIDWDFMGVGPVSYDLSNFLSHFPRGDRGWILEDYVRCMEDQGWQFMPGTDWNLLFDTAECARLANTVIWRALALTKGAADWAFDDLALVDQWFERLEPVVPLLTKEELRR